MEKAKTIDRVCFEKTREAIILSAVAEVSPFIESLDLNNLEENRRLGRVYLEIEKIVDQMNVLNRHQYIYYYKDPSYLFKIFKSTNRLDCPEEMKKLKQAIIFKEIYNNLLMIKMEMDISQHAADFFARNDMDYNGNALLSSGTMDISAKHDQSLLIKGASLEEKLTIITLQLNQRLGFLKYKSSVKQFVQWILHPNTNENQAKILIGCKTNEFKCIMDHFKVFNKDLIDAVIGRSGIFISRKGTIIDAGLIGSTSYDVLNTRHAIANIFDIFI